MTVSEVLVRSQIIGQGTVVNTVNPVVAAETGAGVHRERPAVVHHAGGVGTHYAETVERAVRKHAAPEALAHRRGGAVDIRGAVIAADTVVCGVQAHGGVFASHRLVEAAPQGEGAVSGKGVIEFHPCQINLLALAGIASLLEANRRKTEAGDIGEDVIGVEKDGAVVVETAVVHIELVERRIFKFFHFLSAREREVEHIFYVAVVHGHAHLLLQVVGRLDHERIHTVAQIRDKEGSVRCRGDFRHWACAPVEDEFRILNRLAVVAADDRTLHSSGGFFLRGEKHRYKEGGNDD